MKLKKENRKIIKIVPFDLPTKFDNAYYKKIVIIQVRIFKLQGNYVSQLHHLK